MQPSINPQSPVQRVVHKLQRLAPERIAEVEDFIDFLNLRDQTRQLTQAACATAEPSFNQAWDNSEDDGRLQWAWLSFDQYEACDVSLNLFKFRHIPADIFPQLVII